MSAFVPQTLENDVKNRLDRILQVQATEENNNFVPGLKEDTKSDLASQVGNILNLVRRANSCKEEELHLVKLGKSRQKISKEKEGQEEIIITKEGDSPLKEEGDSPLKNTKIKSWLCADPACGKRNTEANCIQCGLSAIMSKQFRGSGRRNNRGGGGGYRNNRNDGRKKADKPIVDPSDEVQVMFVELSKQLDARHDKRERIVKICRDITIESKRIIFNLHRIKCDDDKPTILGEVERRLDDLRQGPLYRLSRELEGEDHYQFLRAYSGGLQEWVEALSFYHFLCYDTIITHSQVQEQLQWQRKASSRDMVQENMESKDTIDDLANATDQDSKSLEDGEFEMENSKNKIGEMEESNDAANIIPSEDDGKTTDTVEAAVNDSSSKDNDNGMIMVTIPVSEFILGLADLTGELMRNAINSLGSGDTQVCFSLLVILQAFAEGFNRLDWRECPRETGMKVRVLKQSLVKVESACYAISVRGSEIPKNHLADIFSQVDIGPDSAKHESGSDIHFFDD